MAYQAAPPPGLLSGSAAGQIELIDELISEVAEVAIIVLQLGQQVFIRHVGIAVIAAVGG